MNTIVQPVIAKYPVIRDMTYALGGKYPFLKIGSIGESVLGKDILSIEFGDPADRVLFACAFHGQEWLTSLVILRFIENLCESYTLGLSLSDIDIRSALFGRGLIVLPMVNPDGVDIAISGIQEGGKKIPEIHKISKGDYSAWNANANGVDINHNFNAGFEILRKMETKQGIFGPSPRQYSGPCPESEPETQALTKLCRSGSIRHALAFHSQGEEIYWNYENKAPEKSRLMADILSVSSGYTLIEPEGLASHGGFKDWFIEELKKPAFTIEIGRGKNPLPLTDFDSIYNRILEMLILAIVM